MEAFPNVFQCSSSELKSDHPVVQMAGHWNERFFGNTNPIVLELGCGHGEYTVGLAQRYPEKNFIGVDIKGARMWAGAREACDKQLTNACFLRTNIEMLPHFFARDEVDEVWITFPDPQMKKVTKRLTSTSFMNRYQQMVRPNGLIHLKTDSLFLYTYTDAMLKENDYPVLVNTTDLYDPNQENVSAMENARALQTHYERQWLDRGLSIKYLCWALVPHNTWEEPDVEIEKDTYRSYGRNYTTSNQSTNY